MGYKAIKEREHINIAESGESGDKIAYNRAQSADPIVDPPVKSPRESAENLICAYCRNDPYQIRTIESAGESAEIIFYQGRSYHWYCLESYWILCDDCAIPLSSSALYILRNQESGDTAIPLSTNAESEDRNYCSDCYDNYRYYCEQGSHYINLEQSPENNRSILSPMGAIVCAECIESGEIILCADCGAKIAQLESGDHDPVMVCYECERTREKRRERAERVRALHDKCDNESAALIEIAAMISTSGIAKVRTIIEGARERSAAQQIEESGESAISAYPLDWSAISAGNEIVNNRGKIAKRIKNNLRKEGIKLLDPEISEIGNIAANHSLQSREYVIEISAEIEDCIGQFGDGNSCFQSGGQYEAHGAAINGDPLFGMVLIYSGEGERLARALYYAPKSSGIILFNAYGLRLNQIADLFDQSPLEFGERRDCRISGDIYINEHSVFSFGIERDRINLPLDPDDYDDGERCDDCGERLDEDRYYNPDDYSNTLYCGECYHERFWRCDKCDHDYDRESVTWSNVSGENWIDEVCEYCADDYYLECKECGDLWLKDDIENDLCDDCGIDCDDCGERCDIAESGENDLCDECAIQRARSAINLPSIYCDCGERSAAEIGAICADCESAIMIDCRRCANHSLRICGDHWSAILYLQTPPNNIALRSPNLGIDLFQIAALASGDIYYCAGFCYCGDCGILARSMSAVYDRSAARSFYYCGDCVEIRERERRALLERCDILERMIALERQIRALRLHERDNILSAIGEIAHG